MHTATTSAARLLAIDPGYDRCGAAILEPSGNGATVLYSCCITTSKTSAHSIRLSEIHASVTRIIEDWQPEFFAIETLFFSNNKLTAMKVAEARGVLLAVAGLHNLEVIELSPQSIKLAMTGSGNATKEQVQKMVALTTKIDLSKKIDDEVDAIAIGFAALPIAKQKKF